MFSVASLITCSAKLTCLLQVSRTRIVCWASSRVLRGQGVAPLGVVLDRPVVLRHLPPPSRRAHRVRRRRHPREIWLTGRWATAESKEPLPDPGKAHMRNYANTTGRHHAANPILHWHPNKMKPYNQVNFKLSGFYEQFPFSIHYIVVQCQHEININYLAGDVLN